MFGALLNSRYADHGDEMVGRSSDVGPRLQSLLDERDRLRTKIKSVEDSTATDRQALTEMRRELVNLDVRILRQWETPAA